MALTVTALNASASLTTGGSDNAVKTTLQAGSTAFRLHASITNGAAAGNPQQKVVVRYCVSPFSLSAAADAIAVMQQQAMRLELQPPQAPGATEYRSAPISDAFGTYLYTWLEHGTFSPAVVVSLTLVEGVP